MFSKLIRTNEFLVLLIIIILSIVIGLINPAFFSVATIFDILRASNVYNLMAFGLLLVVILGGVDISFVAITAVASYGTHMAMLKLDYQGGIWLYFLIGTAIGLVCGLLNGFLITKFKLPIFDLTLATQTMLYGFSLFFLGATANFDLPEGMVGYYGNYLAVTQDPFIGTTGLHVSVLYVLAAGIAIWWLLKYTMIGRGIYAIGGNREVAQRSGFNINRITMIVFVIMGVLSAITGVTQSGFQRNFSPTLFIGQNLNVLASVILGGASIHGGRGTVIGTFLGVILTQLINRALILTGIPVEWQQFVIGVLLIIFIAIPAIREERNRKVGHTTELTTEEE